MSLAWFAVAHYLIVLLFCGSVFIIGAAVTIRLCFNNFAERLALCTALGLGILSHLILFIGVLGWLTTYGVLMVIALSLSVAIPVLLCAGKINFILPSMLGLGWSRLCLTIGIFLVVGLVAFPILKIALYPPTDFDVTMYHLAVVKMWLKAHAIIATPFLRGQVLPHTAHVLFAALMLIKDDIAAQILSVYAMVLTAIGLFGWGTRLHSYSCGLLAAVLWLGSPAVLAMSGIASYHHLASLFVFASVFSLANYATTKQTSWLFLAAVFVGFAESTWSLTIYVIPVISAAALYFAFKDRRLLPLLVAATGLILSWGPALARGFFYTGNPTYPLFSTIFGPGPWWTADDLSAMLADIHRFGVSRSLGGFLTLPIELFRSPEKFESTSSFCVALFVLFPLVILRCLKDRYLRWLTVVFGYYFVCWFVFGQITRYLLPIIPLLCALTAFSASWLVGWSFSAKKEYVTGVLVIISLALLLPAVLFARREVASLGPVPITSTERDVYLSNCIPEYRALLAANLNPAPMYGIFSAQSAYYANDLFIGDWFGPGRYARIIQASKSGQNLYEVLRKLGARYFFVNLREGIPLPLPSDDPDFVRHFELLYADPFSELYRLGNYRAAAANNRPNLLKNSDFEQLAGVWPAMWGHDHNPLIGTPPGGADSGIRSVGVDNINEFYQSLRISPLVTYELQLKAKSATPGNTFRLQVNWIDDEGKICDVFIRVCNPDSSWHSYSARMTAPSCARMAIVYAGGQTHFPVWLDTFSFKRIGSADSIVPGPAAR